MADFCKQCSLELFGPDQPNDMQGISTPEDTANELYACVLCEHCGPCQVDHTGKCISENCFEKHGNPHALVVRE